MMASLAPRRRINLVDGFLPSPRGRHRRVQISLPRRMLLAMAGYIGVWAAFSAYATVVSVR